jgi:hypothetical protein
METRLAIGAAAGSSSFCKDGTIVNVLAGGAFSTARASRTPKDNENSNKDDDKDPPLDGAAVTTALEGRASDEHDTLWTQRIWMNFFFTILATTRYNGKIKKMKVMKPS